jgi:hypothetical protein
LDKAHRGIVEVTDGAGEEVGLGLVVGIDNRH